MKKEGKRPSGVPPITPKSTSRQNLETGQRADTGGDQYDRATGQYSKNPPVRDEDPFAPYNNY